MNMPLFRDQLATQEIILRDYQEIITVETRAALAKYKKVVVKAPTGAGKTVMSASWIKGAQKKGLRCGFICDRISLIKQTSETFGRYGIQHGVIQGNHPLYNPLENVQVCSIQTLAKRKFDPFDIVIIDECHSLHKKHKEIIASTKFVIGMSATPWTKGLGNHFKYLVHPVGVKELISKDHLSDFVIYGPGTIDMKGAKVSGGDFRKDDLNERSNKQEITGHIVDHWFRHAKGRKTIAFCVNIGHANFVEQEFARRGISSKAINCYMKSDGPELDEVDQALKDFDSGEIQVLVSVDMVSKGFDQPDVDCLILARPTKSHMLFVQQVGRGLRKGGADKTLILDHAGNTERLGFPDDIDFPFLDQEENKEKKERKKKESEIKLPKPCKSCDYLKPVGVHLCPSCGFEPKNVEDISVAEGELQEMKRQKKDCREYKLVDKQNFLGGLNAYAQKKGMRRHAKGFYGWALYRYQDKFGCMPSNKMDWARVGLISDDVKNFITHTNIRDSYKKRS